MVKNYRKTGGQRGGSRRREEEGARAGGGIRGFLGKAFWSREGLWPHCETWRTCRGLSRRLGSDSRFSRRDCRAKGPGGKGDPPRVSCKLPSKNDGGWIWKIFRRQMTRFADRLDSGMSPVCYCYITNHPPILGNFKPLQSFILLMSLQFGRARQGRLVRCL